MFTRSSKSIFISFDYDHDRHYWYLLSALKENSSSAIKFIDVTPSEIDTDDISRVKAVLTQKIRSATHTLVIIGEHANDTHADSVEIGIRNWQWWEIEKSKAEAKRLIAVKISSGNPTPDPLLNSGASWAYSFTVEAILKAIDAA